MVLSSTVFCVAILMLLISGKPLNSNIACVRMCVCACVRACVHILVYFNNYFETGALK